MVNRKVLEKMGQEHEAQFFAVMSAAKELRADLKRIYDSYIEQEDRFAATFKIQDDLADFMKTIKSANRFAKESCGGYITKYDDYLKTKGGQYALAKEILAVMMEIVVDEKTMTKTA